jgi:carbonic anhydrase
MYHIQVGALPSTTGREHAMDRENSSEGKISRRGMLAGVGAGLSVAAFAPGSFARALDTKPVGGKQKTASEALEALMAGNQRFAHGKPMHPEDLASARRDLVAGQSPYAIILACSDSRVPVETVFDQGLGEVFVVRVAGNVVSTDVLGSIEYAAIHLHSPLVYVLGHQKCGAVIAALAAKEGKANEPPHITDLLGRITPGLTGLNMQQNPDVLLPLAVEANVRWSLQQLRQAPELQRLTNKNELMLAAGIYQLESGEVKPVV